MITFLNPRDLNNPDSHFWLYAKNHYAQNRMMDDLKIILGQRSEIDPTYVRDNDICRALLGIVIPLLKEKNEFVFSEFLLELRVEESWRYERKWRTAIPSSDEILAAKCLSFLSLQPVRSGNKVIIELDPVDPMLLGVAYHGKTDDAHPVEKDQISALL